MPKSPEQFYEQHRRDVENYDKHLKEARKAGDLAEYSELWDQASAEYQAETKGRIIEAVESGNYDLAEKLIRDIRAHLNAIEKYKQQKEKSFNPEASAEEIQGKSIAHEMKEEILKMVSEADWERAKEKILGMLESGYLEVHTLGQLAEMRKFNPDRFDKEIEIVGHSWQRLMEKVKSEEINPTCYLLSASDLRAVNPKLFEEQFWNPMDNAHKENIWKRIVEAVMESRNFPREFLLFASALKDLDPERFQQEIGASEEFIFVIWPQMLKEIDETRERYPGLEYFIAAAGRAQNIKPESEPDMVMDEKTWNKLKKELDRALHEKDFKIFFSMANNASRLKVEKE